MTPWEPQRRQDVPLPHASPRAEKVLYLRQSYHFGPTRIHVYLLCYHNIRLSGTFHRYLRP